MSEAHLTRPHRAPAPEKPGGGGGVMRAPKRPLATEDAVDGLSCDGVDTERLLLHSGIDGRKDGGKPLREHRLARPGGADHEHAVTAHRGDNAGALGTLLPDHVRVIKRDAAQRGRRRPLRVGAQRFAQAAFQLSEPREQTRADAAQLDVVIDPVSHEHATGIARENLIGDLASHGPHHGIERQLAHKERPLEPFRGICPDPARMPTAMARSSPVPVLRISPGVRLTTSSYGEARIPPT